MDGKSAKRIDIGRIKKTTGIIMLISALPAAESKRTRSWVLDSCTLCESVSTSDVPRDIEMIIESTNLLTLVEPIRWLIWSRATENGEPFSTLVITSRISTARCPFARRAILFSEEIGDSPAPAAKVNISMRDGNSLSIFCNLFLQRLLKFFSKPYTTRTAPPMQTMM